MLDGVGHDGDEDEVEFDDEDEDSCAQCLHNPTCAQGEGEGCVCLMGDIPVVFYSSITRMQIKMIKLDPVQSTGSNLIRVLLEGE